MSTTNTTKKILFVLPSLDSGGAERVLINYMNALDTQRFKPLLVTVKDRGELGDLVNDDIEIYCLQAFAVWSCLPKLLLTLWKRKPDIVISTMAHMNFAVLLLKPFVRKTAFVVREAITPSYFFERHRALSGLIRSLYRTLYPKADLVLSPSILVLEELSELGLDQHNFKLLRNPVNTEKIRRKTTFTNIHDERRSTVNFVACGRLAPQKGFDRLIEALADADMPTDWRLDIIGEGAERDNLKALIAKHGFEKKVSLTGLITMPYANFAQADCFLLPSRFEGLPNVVLEALACGTPVIATRESGGIREIAEHTSSGTLKIVDTMGDFISEMGKVKPNPVSDFRPSLLPVLFEQETLVKEFQEILKSVAK